MLKILELFGGIGACSKALDRLGINYEIVDYVEIDKYAVKSFNAIHNTNFEPQDICSWNKDIEVDLIMHGSPCQDFSLAGKQAGGDKDSGTRSSLMYETIRIVKKLKPKYVIWENVKNLLSKKHVHNFNAYLETMEEMGYKSYYKVLNAKEYGIPQNRERVFTVSIRSDIDMGFVFPEKQELKLKLKDMLEDNVDEKYYLSDEQVKAIKYSTYNQNKTRIQEKEYADTLCARDWKDPKCIQVNRKYGIFDTEKYTHQAGSVYDENGLSPTLDTMQGGYRQPCIEVKNAYLRNFGSKGKLQDINTSCDTLQAAMGMGGGNTPILQHTNKIRKLTPKECWRLMGFDDNDFEKAEKVNSNSQLYKQAGNSIVVNILEAILRNLFDWDDIA